MLKWLDSSVSLARFLLDSTYLAKADKFIYVGFDEKKKSTITLFNPGPWLNGILIELEFAKGFLVISEGRQM